MEPPLAPILLMPTEVQLQFMRFLPAKDLAATMRTCRFWSELARDETLWRALAEKHWAYRSSRTLTPVTKSMRTYYTNRAAFENHRCNRILFCSDMFIGVLRPDGTDAKLIWRTQTMLIQPTWDPFSRSLIWTERGATEFLIRGCSVDGSNMWTHSSGNYMPFYYYWHPDGMSCSYLGTVAGPMRSMELRVLHVRPGVTQAPPVTRGRPCFWSFCPTKAGALVGRVSDSLVIRRDEDSPVQRIPQWPATGLSPQWSASGRYILVSTGVDDMRNAVVLLNADDLTLARQIVKLTGRTRCMMSRNEQFVFYTDSTRLNLIQRARGIFQGSLHVCDLTTGETKRLTEGPVIAYFIAPDSSAVVWLEETDSGSHVFTSWQAATQRTVSAPPVQLRDGYLEQYLPFFDQYHQSMSIFSPDSTAITFAASYGNEGGVFTLQLAPGAVPRLIQEDPTDEEPIVVSAWSPT